METEMPVKELTLVRVFDAPREKVFRAWTDEKQLAQWWGPKDFTNPVCKLDARPGGKIYVEMTGPDGTSYPMGGEFQLIDQPSHLLFTATTFEDEKGESGLVDSNAVTFEEDHGKTKMMLHAEVIKAKPEYYMALEGMPEGWKQSLDRLEDFLKK
jgi:uncharacterized protein YndB with AHSA1/START domain